KVIFIFHWRCAGETYPHDNYGCRSMADLRSSMREKENRPMTPFPSPAAQSCVERDDESLVNNIRAGDEASFSELVDRYEGRMIRVARAYVGGSATAEEAVQETSLAVVMGLKNCKHRSSFKTWLF